jgi:hypothetical protein
MKVFRLALVCLSLFLFSLTTVSAQNADPTIEIRSGIVTLYAKDPIARTFCFTDAKYGSTISKNLVYNRCSHIDFGNYLADGLSVGIQGGELSKIIDLGSADDLSKRYNYQETVGKGQGWASIHHQNGKLFILRSYRERTFQELNEANAVFQQSSVDLGRTPVKSGNIYLLRISDRHDKNFQILVKLLVLAHSPNESVTFRWEVLDKNSGQNN